VDIDEDQVWGGFASAAAIGATMATKPLVEKLWTRVSGKEPPGNPASGDVEWRDALLWALFTGAAVGLIRLVAQRAAAEGWRRVRGDHPPSLRSTRP
jgi:hypothetical protein